MTGETVSMSEAAAAKDEDKGTRQRSTIAFPYEDLDAAIKLAEAIHGNAGRGDCDDSQLAAWSKQSQKSSGFRIQIAAARLFGLIDAEGGKYKLTELGAAILDPSQAKTAKAQAFLNVPLFKAIFEKYKTGVLPSQSAALEREIVTLGVSEKVKDRARVKFEKSAEQAGFSEHGKNRLVMPAAPAAGQDASSSLPPKKENGGGGNDGIPPSIDPIVHGLLVRLPKSGAVWPEAQRELWLELLKGTFKLIYKDAE